ncbi:MAG TPA: carboxypeptidase-like regulatory domain-containing protein, partial [Actinoplanes sp.]|nr:carboxypeptidase-like regulatory domain-containing protein [Actinoplanes sp.]
MEQGIVADGVYSSRDPPANLKRLGDRATGRRWTLTTHLRARVVQAGALLALVGGILVVAPSAALAAKPNVTIDEVSTDIASGGTTNLKYTITNNNVLGGSSQVQVQVSGISCTGSGCGAVVTIAPGANVQRSATLTAPQVSAGQTKVVNLQITATVDGDTFTANQQLNVHGADKPKTVHQIVGVVKDGKGNAISGANVGMQDSAGATFNTTSNGNGGYVFTASDSKPIATGSIVVGAAKEGYKTVTVTVQGGADKTVNVPLTLQSLTASPSASPSASASASAEPSSPAAEDTAAADQPSAAATDATNAANNSGSGSTLFIILGGLLVAAGIGAIVLVLMRRRDSGDPDDPDDPNGPNGPNGVVPPSHGRFNGVDPTRVGAPVGPRANDATMVANMGGQPSIADAPTMLQRAVPAEDEFPDPYGAPAVTPGNYAGPGGWGTASAAAAAGTYGAAQPPAGTYGGGGGYGAANQYGGAAPAPTQAGGYDDGGYGAHPYARPQNEEAYGAYGAGQYGGGAAEPQRFDEPTGM